MKRYPLKYRHQRYQRKLIRFKKLMKYLWKQRSNDCDTKQSALTFKSRRASNANNSNGDDKFSFQNHLDKINNILKTTKWNMNNVNNRKSDKISADKRYSRFSIKGTDSVDVTEGHKNVVLARISQISSESTKIQRKMQLEDEQPNTKISSVFCLNSDDTMYNITFFTENVKMIPLHFEKRSVPDLENEKEIQLDSSYYYRGYICKPSSRIWLLKRYFHLPKNAKNRRLPIFGKVPPVRVYGADMRSNYNKKYFAKVKKLEKTVITKSKHDGVINMSCNNSQYKIKCKPFQIDYIKPANSALYSNVQSVYNKATINARYKNDVVKFKFDIKKFNIQSVNSRSSRGNQVEDSYTYVPYFCHINSRRVILTIPMSHYIYTNPMIKISSRNWLNALHHAEPKWLTKSRREKKHRNEISENESLVKQVSDANRTSTITAELGGDVFKFKHDHLNDLTMRWTKAYEKFVIEHQRKCLDDQLHKNRFITVIPLVIDDCNLQDNDN